MGALRLKTWMQSGTFCSENQHGRACPIQIPVRNGSQCARGPRDKRGDHLMTATRQVTQLLLEQDHSVVLPRAKPFVRELEQGSSG